MAEMQLYCMHSDIYIIQVDECIIARSTKMKFTKIMDK